MNLALESLAEHDRRVKWERRRATIKVVAEWLLFGMLCSGIGAGVGITRGIDIGKAQEQKRISDLPKQGFSCPRNCSETLMKNLRRRGT